MTDPGDRTGAIALVMPGRDVAPILTGLARTLPEVEIVVWPAIPDPADVRLAVLWKQPAGALAGMSGLEAVLSYGAGVDFILNDDSIDPALPVGRLVDPDLGRQVAAWVLSWVLPEVRRCAHYRQAQAEARWDGGGLPPRAHVGVLGLGVIGRAVADAFVGLGYPVSAWCRSPRERPGVAVHTGPDGLRQIVGQADYLVCTLPLTAATRGLIDAALLARMPRHATFLGVGRGEHLVEQDLLAALAAGRPARAILDVFATEPLPEDHPFWRHPRIVVTPHIAGLTDPERAAAMVAANYRSVAAGRGLLTPVARASGY